MTKTTPFSLETILIPDHPLLLHCSPLPILTKLKPKKKVIYNKQTLFRFIIRKPQNLQKRGVLKFSQFVQQNAKLMNNTGRRGSKSKWVVNKIEFRNEIRRLEFDDFI
jgi:hypothetical protein